MTDLRKTQRPSGTVSSLLCSSLAMAVFSTVASDTSSRPSWGGLTGTRGVLQRRAHGIIGWLTCARRPRVAPTLLATSEILFQ